MMIGRWLRFLGKAGAVTDEGGRVRHFGDPARELQVATEGDVMADLSHLGLIRAQGPDAGRFLQGQLTNDVLALDPGHSQLAGYCTPKGRLLAVLRLFIRDDSYFLQLPKELLSSTLERLKKYVLTAKVSLSDGSDSLVGIGLAGPHCEAELARVVESVPAAVNEVAHSRGVTVLRTRGPQPRFEIYGPVEVMEKAWSRLSARVAPVGPDAWTLLDVLAGIPSIHASTLDEFVPQMVNLDLLDGISFKKGCYTGQEIVARVHYRGTIKRRMYLAHCTGPAAPGNAIYCTPTTRRSEEEAGRMATPTTRRSEEEAGRMATPTRPEEDQAIGEVVSVAPAPEGGYLLLASVMTERRGEPLRLHPAGTALNLRDLPYLPVGGD
jgi:folate-binding protein YgfZ